MTEITRELLDAVVAAQGLTSLERDLAAALRRVLDQQERDEAQGAYDAAFRSAAARYGAALTGTQIEPLADLHPSHEWGETFARERFPLVCRACLARSDRPDASQPCDRAAGTQTDDTEEAP